MRRNVVSEGRLRPKVKPASLHKSVAAGCVNYAMTYTAV